MSIDFNRNCDNCPFINDMQTRQREILADLESRDHEYINHVLTDTLGAENIAINAGRALAHDQRQVVVTKKCEELFSLTASLHEDLFQLYAAARMRQYNIYKIVSKYAQVTCSGLSISDQADNMTECTSPISISECAIE